MSATKVDAFGAKVEEYRERLGMLQMELAKKVGLSKSHLNRIEKGTRKRPKVKTVLRMIEALRLTRGEAKELCDLAKLSPLVLENINIEEDRRGIALVEEGDDQALKSGTQVNPTPLPTMANPALALSESLLVTAIERFEAIIESKHYSEEETERFITALIEAAEMISKVIRPQHSSERGVGL